MEEAEGEEEFLVLVVALTARERPLVHHLVESLHVCLQTLCIGGQVYSGTSDGDTFGPGILSFIGRLSSLRRLNVKENVWNLKVCPLLLGFFILCPLFKV